MDRDQQDRIKRQVKRDRAARRQVEIELQTPKVRAKVWRTSRRDQTSRKQIRNTIRPQEL